MGLIFIGFFYDMDSFSWNVLGPGFVLYSLLSFITGLRFYCWLKLTEHIHLTPTEIISIPARMNLFSYILPFKGGGLWLMWFLKNRYQLTFGKTLGLALQNTLLAASLLLVLVLTTYWPTTTVFQQFLWISTLLILTHLLILPFRRWMQQRISWSLLLGDTALSLLYLLVICLLPLQLLDIPAAQALVFASLILTSALVKLTPGNIGVLEGMAVIAGYWFEDVGFLQFVAYFRVLSLLHAATFGIGAVLLDRPDNKSK